MSHSFCIFHPPSSMADAGACVGRGGGSVAYQGEDGGRHRETVVGSVTWLWHWSNSSLSGWTVGPPGLSVSLSVHHRSSIGLREGGGGALHLHPPLPLLWDGGWRNCLGSFLSLDDRHFRKERVSEETSYHETEGRSEVEM